MQVALLILALGLIWVVSPFTPLAERDLSDLRNYVEVVGARPAGPIEPLPPIVPDISYTAINDVFEPLPLPREDSGT